MQLVEILQKLVSCPSVTPKDAGCQNYMLEVLHGLGFKFEKFANSAVDNFYAQYGESGPLLVFAGHTDVVPAGDEAL